MSILGKIKVWRLRRKEAKREWLLRSLREELIDRLFIIQSGILQNERERVAEFGRVVGGVDDVQNTLKYHFGALDLKGNNLASAIEVLKVENQNRHAHYCDQLNAIKTELNGIRSRYKWVEERYEDAAKGATPRTFNFENRQ